jgi:hypothetical protein
LGAAARHIAEERFDWSSNGRRLVEIYADTLHAQRTETH